MRPGDRKEFGGVMNMLGAAFGREPSPALLEAYWRGLAGVELSAFRSAADRALQTSRYFPTVAELRELAGEGKVHETQAAFDRLVTAIRRVGAYRSADLGPVLNATVRALGGWRRVCSLETDELYGSFRRQFAATFEAQAAATPDAHAAAPLRGLHEAAQAGARALGEWKPS